MEFVLKTDTCRLCLESREELQFW